MLKMSIEGAADGPLTRRVAHGETMGTRFSAIYFAGPDCDEARVAAALTKAVATVDQQMSTWKPDSDISRLNAAPLHEWIDVPKPLVKVLMAGLDAGAVSSGAFDMNTGKEVAAAGFGAFAGQAIPVLQGQKTVSAGQALFVREHLGLVRKNAAVFLDLSAIAKGFGVDEMARCLGQMGISSYLVGIDGEMRAKGRKPDGQSWVVALERPVEGLRDVMGVIALDNRAVATSGDYRHFRIENGQRISHTIDPRTRSHLTNNVASVTVLADTCMRADAMATALMVLGEHVGPRLAKQLNMSALFLVREGDDFREIAIGSAFAR